MVSAMKDDGGLNSLSTCHCTGNGVDYQAGLCDPCLGLLKQCPPKKRFRGYCKPHPIVVKPRSAIALDRLVEVALSPTDQLRSLSFATGEEGSQGVGPLAVAKAGAGHVHGAGYGATGSDDKGSAAMESLNLDAKKLCRSASNKEVKHKQVPRFGLPFHGMESSQKLKRMSSLNKLPPERRAPPPAHVVDHSRRFTPRFKSLLDISC